MEDWAEIRRLRRAEWMPIKQIARVMGVSKNTVKRALAAEGHHLPAGAAGVDRGPGGAAHPGAAWGVADDARDGDRRAVGWTRGLTVLKQRVRGLTAGLPATGPSVADGICRWRGRSV